MKKIEPSIWEKPASKTKPKGFYVQKFVRDQWGEERLVSKTIRPIDDSDAARQDALKEARAFVKEVERQKRTGEIYRRFTGPSSRGTTSDGATLPESNAIYETLLDYVEGHYLPRIQRRNSEGDYEQKKAVWSLVQQYGEEKVRIQDLYVTDIEPRDIDGFVEWLEGRDNRLGKPYRKKTIQRYFKVMKSMIRKWAKMEQQPNPADPDLLEIKPSRIKGRAKKSKTVDNVDLEALTNGFYKHVREAHNEPALKHFKGLRTVCNMVHWVMMYTGLRPSEVFGLRKEHVDFENATLLIEVAAVKGEEGMTKSGKLKGDKQRGTKKIPVFPQVLDTIEEWLMVREAYGFPDSEVIFTNEDGSYLNDRQLRNQYEGACKKAKIPKITPYQMRHSLNDYFRRQGVPKEIRALYLGHDPNSDINDNYTEPKLEEMRSYLKRIDDLLSAATEVDSAV